MLDEIRQELKGTAILGREMVFLPEVDSTNTYAKKIALEGAKSGTAVIADYQTAGRGRMERTFQSPAGKGIYLSVILRPEVPAEDLPCVTALAGVAVCNAVERVCGVRPGLKWPNDPVLGNRKLCGILTELITDEEGKLCLVLGIGVNVSQTAENFTPDVAEIATSLLQEVGYAVSRPALIAALLEELDGMYAALVRRELQEYLAAYRRDCVNLGKTVQMIRGEQRETAEAVGVAADFGLVIRTADGLERTVRSGEVSIRGMYGYVE